MVPVVSIVGKSNSGKTTLLVKVVAELKKRGWRVGTVKHDAHGFEIDHKGKDSWRHKKAGASAVALASPEKLALIKDLKKEWPPERIISSYLTDVDVVVTEGFKGAGFPKIEVVRKANSTRPVCGRDKNLIALAADLKLKTKKPVYGIDDFKGIASLIEKEIIKRHAPAGVCLMADGSPVPLKPFIENLIRDGVVGMIRSLKGCSGAKEIELRIRKR